MSAKLAVWTWHFSTFGSSLNRAAVVLFSLLTGSWRRHFWLVNITQNQTTEWAAKRQSSFFTQFRALDKPYLVYSIWSGLSTSLWSTSPFGRRRQLAPGVRSRQRTSRQVTPHLGYLTNWHSLKQSVKFSLSNTLSGGPDHARWLCEGGEREQRYTNTTGNVQDRVKSCVD